MILKESFLLKSGFNMSVILFFFSPLFHDQNTFKCCLRYIIGRSCDTQSYLSILPESVYRI